MNRSAWNATMKMPTLVLVRMARAASRGAGSSSSLGAAGGRFLYPARGLADPEDSILIPFDDL